MAVGTGLAFAWRRIQHRARSVARAVNPRAAAREETLRWSEKRFRTLIENSSDIISLLDARGTILYKSPCITRVLGFSTDELIGRSAFEVAHPEDKERLMKLFITLLQEPDKTLKGEFRHLHKDGSWLWMEGVASNMLAEPAVQAIVFNFRDISERKRAEAELQEARDCLRRYADELEERVAQRTARLEESLRSLEGILYYVTHDLRAPLRAIHGFTSLLVAQCGGGSNPAAREYGAQISTAAARMDDLIQDLLGYGRLGYLELPAQNVDLKASLGAVLGRMAQEIESKGAEISVAEPLPPVRVHPGTLEQMLTNLIENALKFVAPGVAPRVSVFAEQKAGKVRVSVQDNGIGIPAEYQEKIFQAFERLHDTGTYPGTGIGLAIVRKAAERMGGRVGVDSNPGAGSRFWMELPAAGPEP